MRAICRSLRFLRLGPRANRRLVCFPSCLVCLLTNTFQDACRSARDGLSRNRRVNPCADGMVQAIAVEDTSACSSYGGTPLTKLSDCTSKSHADRVRCRVLKPPSLYYRVSVAHHGYGMPNTSRPYCSPIAEVIPYPVEYHFCVFFVVFLS